MVISAFAQLRSALPQCSSKQFKDISTDEDLIGLNRFRASGSSRKRAAAKPIDIDVIADECFRLWPSLNDDVLNNLNFKSGTAKRLVPIRVLITNEVRKLGKRGVFVVHSDGYRTLIDISPWPTWIAKLTKMQIMTIRDEAYKELKQPSPNTTNTLNLHPSLMTEIVNVFEGTNGIRAARCVVRSPFVNIMKDAHFRKSEVLRR